MTLDEAAAYLKVSPHTVRALVKRKAIPGGKVGGQWRIFKDDLEKFLKDQFSIEEADAV